jgi:uncharacterized protein YraI
MVSEGHQLINHTYSHPSFTGYSDPSGPISSAARKEQIQTCERVIADIAGVAMKPWFRPPYGDYDDSVLAAAGAIGVTSCVQWSLDGYGWKGLTQDQIVNRVASNHGNGYIYLFHVGADSQEGPALPRIIATLRGKGYRFATVAGLLGGGGTPPAAKFVVGDTVKVTAGLYLRTGPGTGYGVITTMPTGTVCTVKGGPTVANGLTWYKLTTPYGEGWAAGEYLEKTSGGTTPPPAAKFVVGDRVRVTAGLYLRTAPGFNGSVMTTMPTGTVCTVAAGPQSANGLTWYQLDTPYGRGWAAGEYLEKTSPSSGYAPGTKLKVTAGLYLRTGPGFSTSVITTMPTGTTCTVVSGPQSANGLTWYQVDTPYGRGWAAGEYMTPA